ncbi:MAG: DUF362 domain-containing protein [Candidatus Lokiarchaeota archaeon]|nr:DUF362 domain-containing protein [Candidatus Lokiarchaeota archaeon]
MHASYRNIYFFIASYNKKYITKTKHITYRIKMKSSKSIVAIVKGNQYNATKEALSLIKDQIKPPTGSRIVLKPNLLSSKRSKIVNTDPNVMLAIKDFFENQMNSKNILIAEGTTHGDPNEMKTAMENNDYFKIYSNWNCFDLNNDLPGTWFRIFEYNKDRGVEVALAKTIIDSNYIVSVPKFKTHDVLGLTLSLKNFMGTLVAAKDANGNFIHNNTDEVCPLMHGFVDKRPHQLSDVENTGPSKLCLSVNLVRMIISIQPKAPVIDIKPSLAVIDGVNAMEGDGPAFKGAKKDLGLIIASSDFIAADTIASYISGLYPLKYIKRAGELGLGKYRLDQIEIVGEDLESSIAPFKPHHLFPKSKFSKEEVIKLKELTDIVY